MRECEYKKVLEKISLDVDETKSEDVFNYLNQFYLWFCKEFFNSIPKNHKDHIQYLLEKARSDK